MNWSEYLDCLDRCKLLEVYGQACDCSYSGAQMNLAVIGVWSALGFLIIGGLLWWISKGSKK